MWESAPAAQICRLICNSRVISAVGQAGDCLPATEKKLRTPGITYRPATGLVVQLQKRAALTQRNDIVGQLRLRIRIRFIELRKGGVSPQCGARNSQHSRGCSRFARAGGSRGRRFRAARKSQPVHFPDNGVTGYASQLCGDLTRRQALGPQLLQGLDPFVSPAHASVPSSTRGG
jgi:hypothetical protein